MDLYKELLIHILVDSRVEVTFPYLQLDAAQIVETASYRALQKIKAVIDDDSLEDSDCFMKIEKIIRVFEDIGSNGGSRHDF